jgi:hypothetical protein
MMNVILAAATAAMMCHGNVPERIKGYLDNQLFHCALHDREQANRCMNELNTMFWNTVKHHGKCFETVVGTSTQFQSGDPAFVILRFRGVFRGRDVAFDYHVYGIGKPSFQFSEDEMYDWTITNKEGLR